jgi:hypothetical protein
MNKTFYANLEMHDNAMADWKQAIKDEKAARARVSEFASFGAWILARQAVQEGEAAHDRQMDALRAMRRYSDNMVKAAEEEME